MDSLDCSRRFFHFASFSALDDAGAIFGHIKSISSKWYEIGSRLGLSEETLKQIRSSGEKEAETALNKVIFAWLHGKDKAKQKGATWNTLIRALKHRSVKEANLAVTIQDFLKGEECSFHSYLLMISIVHYYRFHTEESCSC